MIIRSLCNSCLQAYELVIGPEDKDLLASLETAAGLTSCPRKCGGMINLGPVAEFEHIAEEGNRIFRDPLHLTAKELYGAANGNGLPDEIPSDLHVVESMLRANPIVGSELEDVQGNIYLHSLKLSNGVEIHLGGGLGPRVVKITKPRREHGAAHPR